MSSVTNKYGKFNKIMWKKIINKYDNTSEVFVSRLLLVDLMITRDYTILI